MVTTLFIFQSLASLSDFESGLDLFKSPAQCLLTYNDELDSVFGGPGLRAGSCVGRYCRIRLLLPEKQKAINIYGFTLLSSELAGCAGTGKTQFCLQLCANIQIPAELDGLSGKAVYLDTEGSFPSQRMKQIANATKKNVLEMIKVQQERLGRWVGIIIAATTLIDSLLIIFNFQGLSFFFRS